MKKYANSAEYFSDPQQYKRVEREEHQSVHEYVAGLISTGIIGVVGIATIYNAPGLSKHWKAMWPDMRERIINNSPWYNKAEDKIYKLLGGRRKLHDVVNPVFTFVTSTKYVEEYKATIKLMNNSLGNEIGRLHKRIGNSGRVSTQYIDAIRRKLNIPVMVSTDELANIIMGDTNLARRYRDEMYKAIERIDRVEGDAVTKGLSDIEKTTLHIQEAANVEHGVVGKRYTDTVYSLPTSNNAFQQKTSLFEIKNPIDYFKSIRSHTSIKWTDLDLHRQIGHLGQLKLAKIENQLISFYNGLEDSLTKYCGTHGVTTNIRAEIISYGGDHRGVRFKVTANYNFGGNSNLPGDARSVTKNIDIPLGNIDDKIHTGKSTNAYVGRVIGRDKLHYTAANDYIRELTVNMNKITRGIYSSIMDQTDTSFNMVLNDVYRNISQRIELSTSETRDKSIRTIIDDNINVYYPGHVASVEEKKRIKAELKNKITTYRNAVHSSMSSDDINTLKKEIDQMRFMIGQGDDIGTRLYRFSTMLGGYTSSDPGMAKVFWEVAADHAGWYRYISVFNNSPFKYTRNPQTQQYQYWNVYDLHEKMKDKFPVRWGMDAPLSEKSFKNARILYLLDDVYPFSEDEIVTSARFKDKMDKSIKAYEPREIRIFRDGANGTVKLNNNNVKLNELLDIVQKSGGGDRASGANSPLRLSIMERLVSEPVIIKGGTRVGSTPDGRAIKSGRWDFLVRDVEVTAEEIILKGDANITNVRWRIFPLGKSTPKIREWNTIFSHKYSKLLGNVDIIAGGGIGRKLSPHEIRLSVLMRTIDDKLKKLQWLKERRRSFSSGGVGDTTPVHLTGNVNERISGYSRQIENTEIQIRAAARTLGARYNEALQTIEFDAIRSGEDYFRWTNQLTHERMDQAMIDMGEIYTRKDADAFKSMWRQEIDTGKGINMKGLPENVKEWINKNKPMVGGAKYLQRVRDVNDRLMVGFVGLGQAAGHKQSLDEFFNVFHFKPNADIGIGIKYHELQYLWHKYSVTPDPYKAHVLDTLTKYTEGVKMQMGGDAFAREYHKIMMPYSVKPQAGDRIIDLSNENDDVFKEFKKAVSDTRLRDMSDRMYISPTYGRVAPEEAMRLKGIGEEISEIPAYKIRNENIGILNPTKEYMGSWLKLKNKVKIFMDGRMIETDHIAIPDIMKMKHKPFSDWDAEGEYWMVPKIYDKILRIAKAAIAGSNISDEYGRFADDIVKEYFYGKDSAFKTRTMTAYTGGLQGIMSSGRDNLLAGMRGSVKGGISTLKEMGTGATIFEGVLAPTDIAISSKAFREIEVDIRRLLEEHYTQTYSTKPDFNKEMITKAVRSDVDRDVKLMYKGEMSIPVSVTRHPVTGQHARLFSRMHVIGKLNNSDHVNRIMAGEMLQRTIWGDFDFDLLQVSLASHFGEWEAMEELVKENVYEGQDMFNLSSALTEKEGHTDLYKEDIRVKGGKVIKVPKVYYVKNNKIWVHATETKDGRRRVLGNKIELLKDANGKIAEDIDHQGFMDYLKDCIERGEEPDNFDIDLYQKLPSDIKNDTKIGDAMHFYQTQRYVPLMAQKGLVGTITAWTSAINMIAANNVDHTTQGLLNRSLAKMIQDVALSAKKWRNPAKAMVKFNSFESAYKNMRSANDTYGVMLKKEFNMTDEMVNAFLKIPITTRKKNVFNAAGPAYQLMFQTGTPLDDIPSSLKPMYASMLGKSENEILNHLIGNVDDMEETEELIYGKQYHTKVAADNMYNKTKGYTVENELSLDENPIAQQFNIRGRIDAVINGNVIEEYKTISGKGFARLHDVNPMDEHLSQLNFYMKAHGPNTTGKLIYTNKETNEKKIYDNIVYGKDRWERDYAKYTRAYEGAELIRKSTKTYMQILEEGLSSAEPGGFTRAMADFSTLMRDMQIPLAKKPEIPSESYISSGYFKKKPFIGPLFRNRIDDTMLADAITKEGADVARLGLAGAAVIGGVMLLGGFMKKDQFSGMGVMPGMGGEFWGPIKGSRSDLPWGGYMFGKHVPGLGTAIDTSEHDIIKPRNVARIEMYDPVFQEKIANIPGRILNTIMPIRDTYIKPVKRNNIIIDNKPDIESVVNRANII